MVTSVETGFDSHGDRCGATWVRADQDDRTEASARRPCVVMAHGFGCTRDSGLMPYAEAFAAAGMHVLLFDYRGFGTSGGRPRQLVSHRRQRQDFHAALAFARADPGVDPDRVALWGTSYSGGHVVAVAARDHRVAAVVAQGAAVDGRAVLTKKEKADPSAPPGKGRRMVTAALRDVVRAALRRSPVTVDAVGPPGSAAMLTDASSHADYLAMMGPTWRNEVCARSVLRVAFNRPVTMAGDVQCPTLFVVAERDTIAPPSAVREAARRIGAGAEVVGFDCPHFDLYRDPVRAASLERQVPFLVGALRA